MTTVEDHDGIHPVQCPALPFPDLVEHRIVRRENDPPDRFLIRLTPADQVGRDLQAIEVEQMRLDIPHRQPGGVEPVRQRSRTDGDRWLTLVIHPVDPGLALLHQLRLEAAVTVPGDRHRQFPVLPLQHLGRCPVAPVGLSQGRVPAILIAKMRGQLGTKHPLHELDLQLFHQPGVAKQVFRALHALQQFVEDFFRDGHSCFLLVKHEPDQSYTKDRTLSRA